MVWGYELIMDMHGIDASKITRKDLTAFFVALCERIDMIRVGDPIFWDAENDKDQYPEHLRGITAVQFIRTSNITGHFMASGDVYLNIFSCKEFDPAVAKEFTTHFFSAKRTIDRYLVRE